MELQVIDGGVRVAETNTHYIDVLRMAFNYRVVNTPKDFPDVYDSGFCYQGTSPTILLRAVAAARLWAHEGTEEPRGWNKNVQTGEWRDVPDDLPVELVDQLVS